MSRSMARVAAIGRQALAAPVQVATYKRLAYLLLAFPLGIAYFVVLVTGASLGVSLAITWVGLPILLGTLGLVTLASAAEARLARTFLDRDTPDPAVLERLDGWRPEKPEGGYLAGIKQFLSEPTTWSSIGVVLLKFVFGIGAFTIVVTAAAVNVALLSAPLVYDDPSVSYSLVGYAVTTLPEAIGVAVLGVVGVVVACNLCNVLAAVGGVATERLLTIGRDATDATAGS